MFPLRSQSQSPPPVLRRNAVRRPPGYRRPCPPPSRGCPTNSPRPERVSNARRRTGKLWRFKSYRFASNMEPPQSKQPTPRGMLSPLCAPRSRMRRNATSQKSRTTEVLGCRTLHLGHVLCRKPVISMTKFPQCCRRRVPPRLQNETSRAIQAKRRRWMVRRKRIAPLLKHCPARSLRDLVQNENKQHQ